MIAFEVALLIFFAVIIVTGLIALAKPLTEVFSERMKFRYREMGSEGETMLKNKIHILEEEVVAMKQQMKSLQETVDFVSKQVETQVETQGETIIVSEQQPRI